MQKLVFCPLQSEEETQEDSSTTHDLEHIKPSEDILQISLHVMLGHNSPKTIRIKGKIKDHNINVLIDSGTHILLFKNDSSLLKST